jgi:hypothetical protein
MVIKRRMMWLWAGMLLLGLFSLPCLAQAEPGAAQAPDQKAKAAEAAAKITPALDAILVQVNEFKPPAQKELSAAQTLVDSTKRSFSQMDDKQKAQYCLLQSWLAYYSGQVENAYTNAVKAYKLDVTSGDVWATQVAMAILADKKPMLPRPPKAPRAQRNRPGQGVAESPDMMRNPQEAASQIQPGKLNFDLSQFLAEAVGKKLEPFQLTCLNGTTFGYQPGSEALCVLFWQKFETKKVAVSNEPNQGGGAIAEPIPMSPMMRLGGFNEDGMNGQVSDATPRGSFSKLFLTGLAGGERVKFAAVNLDSAGGKRAVVDQLLTQPQAWAQILLADQATGTFPEFGAISPDRPVLMMADSTGTIRYAGPATGFIAPMLLHKFLKGDLMELAVPTEIKDVADSNSLSAAAADSNSVAAGAPEVQTPAVKPEPQAVRPQPQPRELSEEDKIMAERKLAATKDLFMPLGTKVGLNYARGVKFCREIIKEYPGSEYADQARELMRQVPEQERARYKITDEELGL